MGEQGPKPGARTRERGSDAPDPTHSQARPRRPEEGSALAPPDADTKVERRASVRPSAFGAPRRSDAPQAREQEAQLHSREGPRASSEVAAALGPHERILEAARLLDALSRSRAEARAATDDAEAEGATQLPRLPHRRARGADELVARSARAHGVSLPEAGTQEAARAAGVPQQSPTGALRAVLAHRTRKPWLSLLLFAGMVALSVVPLLRYTVGNEGSAQLASAATPVRRAGFSAPVTNVAPRHELSAQSAQAGSSGVDRERAIAEAVRAGNRTLEAGDVSAAERMFGRVLELAADDHHAAYGLARIRLKQNNLSGAEGWIQLALRKRPRRAAYHTLYAEVLTRMGRVGEARQELALSQANDDARPLGSERTSDQGTHADSDER